jgi:hypothetical protein
MTLPESDFDRTLLNCSYGQSIGKKNVALHRPELINLNQTYRLSIAIENVTGSPHRFGYNIVDPENSDAGPHNSWLISVDRTMADS